MAWKLFGKSKEDKISETQNNINEEKPEGRQEPLLEYHETLHTDLIQSKKAEATKSTAVWRDVQAIENKVDNLHKTRAEKPVTELDKTVDKLIYKRKKR